MSKKTYFNNHEWEDHGKFPEFAKWISPGKEKCTFMCKFCNVTLQLGNMGIAALQKHMKYEKHLKIAENNDTQMKLSFSSNAKDQSTSVMPKSLTKKAKGNHT